MKFILALIFFAATIMPLQAQQNNCLTKSKEFFNEKEFTLAERTLQSCLKKQPNNTDMLISLAGVEMVLGKFNNAEKNFNRALNLLGPKSPYRAYIYSRMGDISMRKANLAEASKNYLSALRYEPANINALVGAGICEEKTGKIDKAVDFYKKALAVDFTNVVSRERLIDLEPEILTNDELLLTMKERNIIDPAAVDFSAEDKELLEKMLTAEKSNAIEYLSKKYNGKIPSGLIVERDSNKVYVRKMLTLTGYNNLIERLSSDAKQFLINHGVTPAELFKLRDANRKDIFNNKGNLTEEGLVAFNKMLKGIKSYYKPGERMPATQSAIDRKVKELLSLQYEEIVLREYTEIQKKTRCSEKTLIEELKVRILDIGDEKKRYFVFAHPKAKFPIDVPYHIVVNFREERKQINNNIPVYSNTAFGLGNKSNVFLCDKKGNFKTISGEIE